MQEINHLSNPFPGLRPFEATETHLFFGRDGQSEELLRRLKRTRFLAVVGTSGSGKSCLVRGGLLPALEGGLMSSAGSDWRIAILRPGGDPIGNLARALASPTVLAPPDEMGVEMQAVLAETTLRRSSLGLVELVSRARAKLGEGGEPLLRDYENLLVVVDQFEELFRFKQLIKEKNSKEDAAAFVKLLLEAVRQPQGKIYVVLTMRSDFLGDCSQFWELPETINDGQYLIPRMTRDERREAITGPVAVGEGPSFLMPPPTAALTGAPVHITGESLVDISHESLIRNWSRLKEWTEEESQSARTYKRLAETAMLHKAGEEALLKDPALQVTLDWREKNKPNAVWGQRYHQEFALAMSFLDASAAARDTAALEAERRRRRDTRRTRVAAVIFFLLSISALTAFASAYNKSNQL